MELRACVERWIASTGRTCPEVDEALAWMDRFGTDYERAWLDCPRGDYMLLMCGALEGDVGRAFDLARGFALEAASGLASVVEWPRITIQRTREWRERVIALTEDDSQVTTAIFDVTEATVERLRTRAALPLPEEAWLDETVREALGPRPYDLAVGVARACEAVSSMHVTHPGLVDMRARYEELCQALALAHATSAATACLVGAHASKATSSSIRSAAARSARTRTSTKSVVRFSRNVMFVEAHAALLHAASSGARTEAGSAETWEQATFAFASGLVASALIARGEPISHNGANEERRRVLEHAYSAARSRRLADAAEALRLEIPFGSLRLPPQRGPGRPDSRRELRETVALAYELARRNGPSELASKLAVAWDVVDAPRPPSAGVLLPLLTNIRAALLPSCTNELRDALDRSATLLAEDMVARAGQRRTAEHN